MGTLRQKPQLQREESVLARHQALFRVARAINVYRDPGKLFRALGNELLPIPKYKI